MIVVLHIAGVCLHYMARDQGGKRTSSCPLAITAMAIPSDNRLRRPLIANGAACTTTSKVYSHEKSAPSILSYVNSKNLRSLTTRILSGVRQQ